MVSFAQNVIGFRSAVEPRVPLSNTHFDMMTSLTKLQMRCIPTNTTSSSATYISATCKRSSHKENTDVMTIHGYYKRNRHFQCCIEKKLLMIWPKYFTWFCSACFVSLYDEVTNMLCVSLLSQFRYHNINLIV
jgi:hypothetical protein